MRSRGTRVIGSALAALTALLGVPACSAILGIEDAQGDWVPTGADASADASGCPPGGCDAMPACGETVRCPTGQTCVGGTCRSTSPDAAPVHGPDGSNGLCPEGTTHCHADGEACLSNADCASDKCTSGICRPGCSPLCGEGAACAAQDDCSSAVCSSGTCRVSCSPDCPEGAACIAADDCTTNTCTSGTCRPACFPNCNDGTACQVAGDCTSNNCVSGICRPSCHPNCVIGSSCTVAEDCATSICTSGMCRPSCSPDCAPGDACQDDDDCTGTCDPTAHVCLQVCEGDRTVTNAVTRDDIRYCSAITGNLYLQPEEPLSGGGLDPNDFLPYLKSVGLGVILFTGTSHISTLVLPDLETAGALALSTQGDSISFPKLSRVGPKNTTPMPAEIYVTGGFATLELPALTTVNGDVQFAGGAVLSRINAPELTTVSGSFMMAGEVDLADANLYGLDTVGGDLTLEILCKLPYSEVSTLNTVTTVGGTKTVSEIGCCTLNQFGCNATTCSCN